VPARRSEWLEPLNAAISAAGGRADELALVFDRLQTDLGADEAGRRWWAAWGATDASAT
jgi:hypothetical protein